VHARIVNSPCVLRLASGRAASIALRMGKILQVRTDRKDAGCRDCETRPMHTLSQAFTRIGRALRALWGADRTIVALWMRVAAFRAAALFVACVLCIAALVAAEAAAFLTIAESTSSAGAAAVLCLCNVLLALVLVATASIRMRSPRIEAAREVHGLALELLAAEVGSLPEDALWSLVESLAHRVKSKKESGAD